MLGAHSLCWFVMSMLNYSVHPFCWFVMLLLNYKYNVIIFLLLPSKYMRDKQIAIMELITSVKRFLDRPYFVYVNHILYIYVHSKYVEFERTSDSLNEGLPIKMTREKFQRKRYFFYEKDSRFIPRLIHKSSFLIGHVPN